MVLDIPGGLFGQDDVRETPAATSSSSSSSTIIAPIGSILPWLKSYANTPAALPTGWVECDGSVLSDADSVYNGQTLPNLNGNNQFPRGNSTSGGTGGATTHKHGLPFVHDTGNIKVASTFGATGSTAYSGELTKTSSSGTADRMQAENTTILPKYYNVVWIMRVK